MPTSAQDRFEQLFTNKPRPVKPATNQSTSVGDTTRTGFKDTIATDSGDREAVLSSAAGVPNEKNAASSEDDEYSELFEKKPEMKTRPLKSQSSAPPNDLKPCNKNDEEASSSVAYIPEGKPSSKGSKTNEEARSADSQDVSSYTGNGRALTGRFCSFHLVAKFPYKYMKDPNDRVSRQFFADNKFYNREWDLYYLHPPQTFYKGALILVPLSQVQKLMDEIAAKFKIELHVPKFPFTLDFYDDGTPQPIFIAKTKSRDDVNENIASIPTITDGHGECPQDATETVTKSYLAFHDMIERALLAIKGKSTGSTQNKAQKLLRGLEESRNQLKRTERYLGLRPRTKPIESSTNLSWDEEKRFKEEQQKSCGLFLDFLEVVETVQYPFEEQPVFIAIDFESYERNHGFITEIGISTLDTLDLVGLPPGPSGENWIKHIRSRHFRIRGREHLINKDFCVGYPENFQFGKSEFVALVDVAEAVDSCFEWPFSVQFTKDGPTPPSQSEKDNKAAGIDPSTAQKGPRTRNLVVVGHDVGTDLNYLQKLGSQIFSKSISSTSPIPSTENKDRQILATILETLDTAQIYKSFKGENQTRSLSHVCSALGIDAWFAHNAGNDARYTLEALVKVAIHARLNEDEEQRKRDPESKGIVESEWEAQKMRHIDERVEAARQKIRRKVLAQEEDGDAVVDTSTSVDPNEEIDWTLPIRPKKAKKAQQGTVDVDELVRQHNARNEELAARANWVDGSESVLPPNPRAGW